MSIFGSNTYRQRLERVRREMVDWDVDALFLPPTADLLYLTGLPRSGGTPTETNAPGNWAHGVLLTPDRATYITPRLSSLFGLEAVEECAWIDEIVILEDDHHLMGQVKQALEPLSRARCLALPDMGMARTVIAFTELFPGLRFVSSRPIVGKLRMIKSAEEIEQMRRAAEIADGAMLDVIEQLEPGMTELEITNRVEVAMQHRGAAGPSFPTSTMIRGIGVEHINGTGGGRERPFRLQPGDTISFDLGAIQSGYCSDFGRTAYCGEPAPEVRRVHELVMAAQAAGIRALGSGKMTCAQVDAAARAVIEDQGYGPGFLHRLGHGIGLDVHESPFLTGSDDTPVQPGMTFTVEPSVFLPGHGFIRTEDVVLVTADGAESFSRVTRGPIVIEL